MSALLTTNPRNRYARFEELRERFHDLIPSPIRTRTNLCFLRALPRDFCTYQNIDAGVHVFVHRSLCRIIKPPNRHVYVAFLLPSLRCDIAVSKIGVLDSMTSVSSSRFIEIRLARPHGTAHSRLTDCGRPKVTCKHCDKCAGRCRRARQI